MIHTLRRAAEGAMTDKAMIYRKTTENVGGEETDSWSVAGTVKCYLRPAGGGETGEVGGRVADETTHIVSVPAGSDVEEPDVLEIDGSGYAVTLVRRWGKSGPLCHIEVKEATVPEVD